MTSEIPLIIRIFIGKILNLPPKVNSPNGNPKVTSSVKSAMNPKINAPRNEKESITVPPWSAFKADVTISNITNSNINYNHCQHFLNNNEMN
ncbi:hypothetical protein J18TS1_04130 [Oceanobacillus oncorhynchi subsp. incaldanensis]|nr:hypothetical protein J18TS1_04130 [Oceanobacillus oncorhynchi subsp. incaldanensis]